MDIPFQIPGSSEPTITVRRSFLGNISVLVDGTPVKRRPGRDLTYDIPNSDGTFTEVRLTGQWTGLRAAVNGMEAALEPRVPRVLVGLTFVPLLLVVIGGLIGGLFGVITAGINVGLSRRALAWPVKLAAMLGVTAVGVGLYLATAFLIAPIPTFTTGSCLNGVHEGAELSAARTRPVDCAVAHENEVVGSIDYPGNGAYPGMDVLFTFAETPCYEAFAAYVGVAFDASALDMILVTPTDLTWIKGDRVIACVAIAPSGQSLTGSVRGSAR